MEAYKVIKPATLQELDDVLRANPLGSKFPIIIEENLDGNDIAKRRGVVPKKEEATFSPTSIDVGKSSENTRIIMTMGITAINGVLLREESLHRMVMIISLSYYSYNTE